MSITGIEEFYESDKITKKLIDYYIEIEKYQKHLESQKKLINEQIMNCMIRELQKDRIETKYCKAELYDKEITTNCLEDFKKLKDVGLYDVIKVSNSNELAEAFSVTAEIFELYRKYILNKKSYKKLIVDYLIENNYIYLLTIDKKKLNEIANSEDIRYLKNIVETVKNIKSSMQVNSKIIKKLRIGLR